MVSKQRISSVVVLVLLASGLLARPAEAQTPVEVGYRDFSFGTSVNTPTGEKAESKLWWNDGSWWGILFNAAAAETRIYRFDSGSQAWTDTGTAVDDRSNTRADVLWDDGSQRLYVVSHLFTTSASPSSSSSQWGRLWRFSYDSTLREYTLEAGFPVNVTRGRCETLTIAKDASQRLWVTFVESRKVKINWSVSSDHDWGVPVDLPLSTTAITVDSDDISAIVGLPNGDVGLAWSNQDTRAVYFSVHRSVDAPTVWQPFETVVPGSGCSGQCADDHLNLKTDQAGRVFLALKTSHEEEDPLIILAVRDGSTWSRHTVGIGDEHHTRPIVLLDEEDRTIYVIATQPESGGAIHVKTSSLDSIQFAPGIGERLIFSSLDDKTNNATSTKQNVTSTTGLLVLASDQDTNRYLHNFLPLGGGTPLPPQPPANLDATVISPTRVDLTWNDGSNDETAFHLERRAGSGSFVEIAIVGANVTAHSDLTAQPDTTYTYRVRAKNGAGFSNFSNSDQVATPPVVAAPPSAPTDLDVEAIASSQVDLSWTDMSDNEVTFHIERAIGGGGFGEIDTVAANATSYSDTTTTGNTTYTYRVRAKNAAGFSLYSNTDAVMTPSGADPGTLKTISFESGVLTGPVNGADTTSGTVQLESAAPLKQNHSARIPGASSSFLQEDFAPASNLYVSFYVRLVALPAGDVRMALISNGGTSVGNVLLRTNGRLRLRVGSTTIGTESAPLTVGQLYRVGLQQKAGSGNAVLQAFLASGDAAFTAPFASTATGNWTTTADRLRLGATTGAINAVFDDIVVATLVMPGPSTGGGLAPPSAPTGLVATAISSGQVDLSWSDNSNAETTYHIERRLTNGTSPFQEIDAVGANVTAYSDATVAPETGYSYRVFAVNGQGPSGFSNTADVTTPPVAAPPSAPTALGAVAADSNRVDLSWTDNASNESVFHIERGPVGGPYVEIDTVGANVTAYSDLTVNPESSFSYRVRASNGQGFSVYSNTADVTTPPTSGSGTIKAMTFEGGALNDPTTGADSISGTVTLETTSPLKGVASAHVPGTSGSYLNETFTPAADLYVSFYLRLTSVPSSDTRLALISNGGESMGSLLLRSTGRLRLRLGSTTIGAETPPLAAGQLYRIGLHQKAGTGGNAVLEGFIAVADAAFGPPFASSAAGTWTTAADRLRLGSTTGAVNAVFDDVTLDIVGMPGPSLAGALAPPSAPTALTATAGGGQVDLEWDDTAVNEGAFAIERADEGGAFAGLDVVGANVTSHNDPTVAADSTYAYRVRAHNAGGFSDYSNTAVVTTGADVPGPPDPPSTLTHHLTFEGGSLTDPATGADVVRGVVVLESAEPLDGLYSARVPGAAASYLEKHIEAADEVFLSFDLEINELPDASARVVLLSNGGTSVGNLLLQPTGELRLRAGSSTVGQSEPLAPGETYRVGLRQLAGDGASAVLEAFVAPADAAFDEAFAGIDSGAWTTAADRLRIGATTSAAVDLVVDDIAVATDGLAGASE